MSVLKATYVIEGSFALRTDNIRRANELSAYAKRLKAHHRRSKEATDPGVKERLFEDWCRLEWESRLYHSETEGDIGPGGVGFYIPGNRFRASLKQAAKQRRMGKLVGSSVCMDEISVRCPLELPDIGVDLLDLDAVYKEGSFVQVWAYSIGKSRMVRVWPQFENWKTKCTFLYDSEALSSDLMDELMHEAGVKQGIGDRRSTGHGRFEVLSSHHEELPEQQRKSA